MPCYADYLESGGAWIQELVCHRLGLAPLRTADHAAWEAVAARFLALPHLQELLAGLSELERDLLWMAVFPANGASDREILDFSRRQGYERNEAQEALYHLARTGLLFCSRGWSNDITCYVPPDLAGRLLALRGLTRPPVLTPAAEAPRSYRSEELALHRDLYTLLTAIEKEPPQLTQQTGLIYKRQLEKGLLPKLEIQERAPADGSYPPRFSFLFDFCRASQLLLKSRDSRVIVSPGVPRWFALSPLEQARALFSFWEYRCLKAGWRFEQRILVRVLSTCEPGVWYDATSLAPLVQTWFGKAPASVADTFKTLAYQSLLDLALDAQGHPATFRLTELGAALLEVPQAVDPTQDDPTPRAYEPPITTTFLLQPNYEVLVPRTMDLSVRHRLDQIADLLRADTLSRYRLSEASVQRAMELGWEVAELLDFLRHHSEADLPQNVQMTITDWAERYGRITFWDVFVMRVADRALAKELQAHPAIAPFLHGEIAPTAFICARKEHPQLVAALKAYGYWPRVGVIHPEPADAQAPKAPARDVLILDFGAGQRLPLAINQQIAKPTGRKTGPLRRKERGGRDLPSAAIEELVKTAIDERKQLEIEYLAPASGRTRRTIDPKLLTGDQVEAFCHLRSEDRRFALHNILEIWVLE
ncbi:MAG TPA: helicase-associated domain-containing protein [Stenomitos sp.]